MKPISDDVRTHLGLVAETCESHQLYLAGVPEADRTLDDKGLDQLAASFLFLYYHYVLGLDTPERKAAYKARVAFYARGRRETPDDENMGDA